MACVENRGRFMFIQVLAGLETCVQKKLHPRAKCAKSETPMQVKGKEVNCILATPYLNLSSFRIHPNVNKFHAVEAHLNSAWPLCSIGKCGLSMHARNRAQCWLRCYPHTENGHVSSSRSDRRNSPAETKHRVQIPRHRGLTTVRTHLFAFKRE